MTSTAITRSAILLGLASLILPGAGQALQRRFGRALLLLLLAAALWHFLALGYLVHLWAAFDAALYRRP
jgi:hypothetical protein